MGPEIHVPLLPSEVIEIESGVDSDCLVRMRCNHKEFEVLLPVTSLPGSIERSFVTRITKAQTENNYNAVDEILEELADLLALKCQPWFRKYTEVESVSTSALSSYIYPDIINLVLSTQGGQPQIALRDSAFIGPNSGDPLGLPRKSFAPDIPNFRSSEVIAMEQIMGNKTFHIHPKESNICAKIMTMNSQSQSMQREITILLKLNEEGLNTPLRIPTLKGFVVSEDNSQVLGFLMNYIETKYPRPDLGSIDITMFSQLERNKWKQKITSTVEMLHNINVVWGDAKPGNILLDKNDDLWLVDFGGGVTKGWVDDKLMNSREGDLQGLERIQDFITID